MQTKYFAILAFSVLAGCTARVALKSEPTPNPEIETLKKQIATQQVQIEALKPKPPQSVSTAPVTGALKAVRPGALTASKAPLKDAAPTVLGVIAQMSDGSQQVFPMGTWLTFQNGLMRVIFPVQYVGQIANVQADNTWKYNRPGRNVQVWRNGVLQRETKDYMLVQATMTITPLPITLGDGTIVTTWNTDDYVTVAYIF